MSAADLDLFGYNHARPTLSRARKDVLGLVEKFSTLAVELAELVLEDRVEAINAIRQCLSEFSPFKSEPVDFVKWVPSGEVHANDYNPNSVAPPEMELLRLSIMADGYTQPIVTNREAELYIVIDGFHRNRVGKECDDVRERVHGYLPVVQIRAEQTERPDRMAATVRHNRARGKHRIDGMAEIVLELKRRNWSNEKIGKQLGMDPDEVLRLAQITGLAEMFADREFSRAWEPTMINEDDDLTLEGENARTTITNPERHLRAGERIYYPYDALEEFHAGMWRIISGEKRKRMIDAAADLMRNPEDFKNAMRRASKEWIKSCEFNLTSEAMNRVAWLGHAGCCIEVGSPEDCTRLGWHTLNAREQDDANRVAGEVLLEWIERTRPLDLFSAV